MTTKINQTKTLEKCISCDSKCKFNSTACNSNQKWNNVICHCEWKKYHMCRKNYSWNSRTCICENSRNLKGIVHDLVIVSDEIINVTYSVSKNVTNTIPKYYTNKCHKYCFRKLWWWKRNVRKNWFPYSHYFIMDYLLVIISCHSYQMSLLLCKKLIGWKKNTHYRINIKLTV